ncbi:uncharacterized protein LOC123258893 [Cotesia glomerata]|uniref:uncharacterized protein LOC123258893 n=1 Tax=Cotesia glomerata TaxID=32391 RepID=UPI001D018A74|nr:uncharacterized protein LOC123258893 [Cotesia glomerata]
MVSDMLQNTNSSEAMSVGHTEAESNFNRSFDTNLDNSYVDSEHDTIAFSSCDESSDSSMRHYTIDSNDESSDESVDWNFDCSNPNETLLCDQFFKNAPAEEDEQSEESFDNSTHEELMIEKYTKEVMIRSLLILAFKLKLRGYSGLEA